MTFIKKMAKPDPSIVQGGCAYCSNDSEKKAGNNTAQYASAQNRCSNCAQ